MPPIACQALPVDLAAQDRLTEVFRQHGVQEDPFQALARAVAASPGWPREADPVLVVRPSPHPCLAAFGAFGEGDSAWLRAHAQALSSSCRRLRYVGYPQVQKDCELLAQMLLDRLGMDGLRRCRFAAIPRGGLIVLGLLASALGLNHDQLVPLTSLSPDGPLVVVDDCAVSGARLARALDRCEARGILFACLYSPPGLRSALEAGEPQLLGCLSAADLEGEEFAPEVVAAFPDEPGVRRFWHGMPETLAFPWNEPDRLLWNPASGRYELAWRVVPPELCLKNRPAPGTDPIPVQILPAPRGPLQPRDSVLYADLRGTTVVADLERGRSFRLDGSGADFWKALVKQGGTEPAAASLTWEYDAPQDRLREDLDRFASELLAQGLLELR